MIQVNITKNQNQNITGFTVSGHAGFAKKGNDIVCAAVSVLVFNTINSIQEFTPETLQLTADNESGFIQVKTEAKHMDAQLLLKSMALGLDGIKEQYGHFIEIHEEVQP